MGLRGVFFNIYSYAAMYALFGVLSLSYHACFNSSLSTLEKRYHFSSSTGGLIMITDNIANILTNLFIGYYGKTAHKPRWMAIGCAVTGLSVMITSLPYFLYGPAEEIDLDFAKNLTLVSRAHKLKTQGDQVCLSQAIEENCSLDSAMDKQTMTLVAVACFAISNFFRGFGTSIYFTYGTPYLDDNISKTQMPTVFGFIYAIRMLGLPAGFAMTSLFLKFYENPFTAPPNLVANDPRWIGAWWPSFIISGSLMLVISVPLAFFPREFKRSPRRNRGGYVISLGDAYSLSDRSASNKKNLDIATVEQEFPLAANGNHQIVRTDRIEVGQPEKMDIVANRKTRRPVEEMSLRELPREVFQIVSNPLIICQMLGNMFRGIGVLGFYVYQAKFLESQFWVSASDASQVTGTTGLVGKVFGLIFGGALISLLRPGPRKLTTFIFLVECTSIFTLMYATSVHGPIYMYPSTQVKANNQLDLMNECNAECFCDNLPYQPVCQHDEMKAYFSPCHAGCRNSFRTADNSITFTECTCSDAISRTLEKCPPDMGNLRRYALVIAIGSIISGSSRSGNMVTFMRSINPDQKPLATAALGFWHSLTVSIPYPIIYGKIFDFSCLVWSKECGKRGNCWLYDTNKLRYIYHGVSIGFVILGSFFDFIMIFLSPRLGNLYDDPDEQEPQKPKSSFRDRLLFWRRRRDKMELPTQRDIPSRLGNNQLR